MLRRTGRALIEIRGPAPDHILKPPPEFKIKRPGRKSLDEVVKLELLEKATPPAIMNMWITHHQLQKLYWGRVITAEAYDSMFTRLKANPYFVVPVFRDKGLFNVVTNYQEKDDIVLCSPLGEWQKLQDHAPVHMVIQFFTELKKTKGLVLVRCEIQDQHMHKQDCMFITHCLLKYYTLPHNFRHVELFNKDPSQFNYHNYLRQIRDEARVETGKGKGVEILDEKKTWRSSYTKPVDPSAGSA